LFGDMKKTDEVRRQHGVDTKYRYAESKRLDALGRYKSDLIAKGEDNRSQRLRDAEFEKSRVQEYTANTQLKARLGVASIAAASGLRIQDRLDDTHQRSNQGADAKRLQSEVERNYAALQELQAQSQAAKDPNAPHFQEGIVAISENIQRLRGQQFGVYNKGQQFRGDSPVVSTQLVPTAQGLVSQGQTEDGNTVQKTTFGEPVSEDGSDITVKSVQQEGFLLELDRLKYGGSVSPVMKKLRGVLINRKEDKERGNVTPGAVPTGGNPQWTSGTAAPAAPAAPAEEGGNEASALSPDQLIELSNSKEGGGYTPQALGALSEFFAILERDGPGSPGAIQAGSDAEQAINEDPATIANDTVGGKDEQTSNSLTMPASERVDLRGTTVEGEELKVEHAYDPSVIGGEGGQPNAPSLRERMIQQLTQTGTPPQAVERMTDQQLGAYFSQNTGEGNPLQQQGIPQAQVRSLRDTTGAPQPTTLREAVSSGWDQAKGLVRPAAAVAQRVGQEVGRAAAPVAQQAQGEALALQTVAKQYGPVAAEEAAKAIQDVKNRVVDGAQAVSVLSQQYGPQVGKIVADAVENRSMTGTVDTADAGIAPTGAPQTSPELQRAVKVLQDNGFPQEQIDAAIADNPKRVIEAAAGQEGTYTPDLADKAWQASRAVKGAVGDWREKQAASKAAKGPAPGPAPGPILDELAKVQDANANPYKADLTPTPGELADVVMTGDTSSPFPDNTRNRPKAGTESDPWRDAQASIRYANDGRPNADKRAQAALGGERFSLRDDVAAYQTKALDYDTRKAFEADQGIIDPATGRRTVA
jgi:hypothetical protein